jgi:hypothetical protein
LARISGNIIAYFRKADQNYQKQTANINNSINKSAASTKTSAIVKTKTHFPRRTISAPKDGEGSDGIMSEFNSDIGGWVDPFFQTGIFGLGKECCISKTVAGWKPARAATAKSPITSQARGAPQICGTGPSIIGRGKTSGTILIRAWSLSKHKT